MRGLKCRATVSGFYTVSRARPRSLAARSSSIGCACLLLVAMLLTPAATAWAQTAPITCSDIAGGAADRQLYVPVGGLPYYIYNIQLQAGDKVTFNTELLNGDGSGGVRVEQLNPSGPAVIVIDFGSSPPQTGTFTAPVAAMYRFYYQIGNAPQTGNVEIGFTATCSAQSSTNGGTPEQKSNITDYLLSTFNQFGGSIFEPEGIPAGIVSGGGISNGGGLAFAPHSSPNSAAALFGARPDMADPSRIAFGSGLQSYEPLRNRDSDKGFSFSVDLRSLMAKTRKEAALGASGMDDGGYVPYSPWNVWVAGRYTKYDDDEAGADRNGHLWWVTSGLSYQVSSYATIGGLLRVRQGEVDSIGLDADLESEFLGGGLFIVIGGNGSLRLMAGALYESGDNDIRIGAATAGFDSDQVTLEARLDKRFEWESHWIEPAVKVLYTDLKRDGYTDSTGAAVAGSNITLGRLTFGPKIGTTIQNGNTAIKPFARINGVWDFENVSSFTLVSGTVVSAAETAINLGGGVEIVQAGGLVLTASGDWFSFDTELEGWSVTGGLGIPAHLLGLGGLVPAGFVSLDFTGRESEASATARLRIPFGKAE